MPDAQATDLIVVNIVAKSEGKAKKKAASLTGFTVVRSFKADWTENVWCFAGVAESPIDCGHHRGDAYVLNLDIDYDQEGLTAKDYVFAKCDEESDDFFIVRRSYWNARGAVHDNDSAIDDLMPAGFGNTAESMYEYYRGDVEAAKKALLAAGFSEAKPHED